MSSNDSDDHGSSHAKTSDRSRSDRKEHSRGSDFERSKNRERDRGGREKDRDHYSGRDKFDDYDSHGRGGRGRNTERHSDYGRDRDRRYRNRPPSPSKERLRQRSRSPSPSKSKRKSGFDMAPAVGGMLPSAAVAGVPQTMPGLVQNFMSFGTPQVGALSLMPAQAMTQQATRHARRVYVGGLPPTANEQTIATFFSRIMATIGGNSAGPGDAVVNVYINHEKKFAFVEMRTVEEASNAMALDGVIFEGIAVRVRRPTDYNPSLAATLGPSQPNPNLNLAAIGLSPGTMGGVEGPDRVFVGGLPYYFNEMQIRELLESFGPLHGFDLVKDRETGNSKGYGFCVYKDPAVTDIACAALNGLKMGDKTLTVRRATASGQPKSEQENILAQAQHDIAIQKMVLQAGGMSIPGGADTSKILCLSEAITIDVLEDDEEYQEILEDMQEECGKFGTLIRVVIPRPTQTGVPIPGAGKVFLEYSDTMGSSNAKHALDGRKFGGNTVRAFYYPEDKYVNGDYDV